MWREEEGKCVQGKKEGNWAKSERRHKVRTRRAVWTNALVPSGGRYRNCVQHSDFWQKVVLQYSCVLMILMIATPTLGVWKVQVRVSPFKFTSGLMHALICRVPGANNRYVCWESLFDIDLRFPFGVITWQITYLKASQNWLFTEARKMSRQSICLGMNSKSKSVMFNTINKKLMAAWVRHLINV